MDTRPLHLIQLSRPKKLQVQQVSSRQPPIHRQSVFKSPIYLTILTVSADRRLHSPARTPTKKGPPRG